MLRSAATFHRTEVHHEPPMQHPTTRNLPPTPTPSAGHAACWHTSKFAQKPATGIRLFKD